VVLVPLVRALTVGAVTAAVIVASASAVLAHATYESSEPPDEGTVRSPPSQVTAEFSEPLIGDNSFMDVTDPCGADVGGATSVTAKTMTVEMSATRAGEYVVSWQAHSSVDGHITKGSFWFTSTGGADCPGENGGDGGGGAERGSGSGGPGTSEDPGSGAIDTATEVGDDATGASRDRNPGSSEDKRGSGASGDNGEPGKDGEKDRSNAAPVFAQAPRNDVPDEPSALDGIPIEGLVITLAVAALIGAAAGKIYVSLDGDDS